MLTPSQVEQKYHEVKRKLVEKVNLPGKFQESLDQQLINNFKDRRIFSFTWLYFIPVYFPSLNLSELQEEISFDEIIKILQLSDYANYWKISTRYFNDTNGASKKVIGFEPIFAPKG